NPLLSIETLERIKGMTVDNKEQLLDMNLMDPKLALNPAERKQAIRIRDQLKRDPSGNPHLSRAWKALEDGLSEQLNDLGLLKTSKDDPTLLAAKGYLVGAIEAWEETHKGAMPTHKDIVEDIGPRLLRHTIFNLRDPTTWSSIFGAERPMYEKEVPEDWAEQKRQEVKAAGGTPPTDYELAAAYRRKVWLDIYQGLKVAPK